MLRNRKAGKEHSPSTILLPVGLFVILSIVLAVTWRYVRSVELESLRRQTEVLCRQTSIRLEEHLRIRLSLVDGLREEWLQGRLSDPVAFRDRVLDIQERFPGYQAINWVDGDGIIRWVVPVEDNVAARGRDLHEHPTAGEWFGLANSTGEVQITPPLELFQGGRGFASYFPIDGNGDGISEGFINGVFRIDQIIDDCLSIGGLERYRIRIRDGDTEVHTHGRWDDGNDGPDAVTDTLEIGTRTWVLDLAPSRELLAPPQLAPNELTLLVGLMLTAGLALLTRVALVREARFERERLRLSHLVEASDDLIAMAGTDGRVMYVNRGGRDLLGIDPRFDVRKLRVPDLHPGSEKDRVHDLLKQVRRSESWKGPMALKDQRTGVAIPTDLRAFPIPNPETGEVEMLAAIARDLRERRSLENQLRHAQKMEALGRLAGGMAHDFNNLLTAVSGYAELVLSEENLSDDARDSVREIAKASIRGGRLTGQLLTFSRKQLVEPRAIDFSRLIVGMEAMLRRLIREDIELHTDLAEDLWPVLVDRGQMEQVVVNLVLNACDAMPDGGRLSLVTRNAPSVDVVDEVVLVIHDTGVGMPEHVRDQVFEPFFTTKEVGKGTGLGLSIVYGIVTSYGGTIEIESDPGQGTTFEVRMPRCDDARRADSDKIDLADGETGTGTVLLVEDDEPVRRVVRRLLQRAGYEVLEASDGQGALDIVEQHGTDRIDIVLTDIIMPGMGGRDLAERLREIAPSIRIVFTSGYTDALVDEGDLERLGATFLAKPYSAGALLEKLRELLSSTE